MEQKGNWLEKIIIIFTTAVITFLMSIVILTNKYGHDDISILNNFSSKYYILDEIMETLKQKYVDEIDEEKLIEGAAQGMVAAVGDEYTTYISKEDAGNFETAILGSFDGIGIYIGANTDNNQIVVIAPIEGSPADEADIKPNDIILKVDDVEYNADSMDVAVSKIKGTPGTTVKLTIKRDNEIIEKEVKRETVKLTHVETEVLDKNIGYVKLSSFDQGCSTEFEEKVEELINEEKVKGLIIDLRNNPGGILTEVIKIADYLLPECNIVSIQDSEGGQIIYKSSNASYVDLPIVVLTNGNSASASEILAGAIKDNGKGKIVGKTTYGKGTVQEVISLSDGSIVKITTNKYYTPSGVEINKVGIIPDVEVDISEEYKNSLDIPQNKDAQLKKAIEEINKML